MVRSQGQPPCTCRHVGNGDHTLHIHTEHQQNAAFQYLKGPTGKMGKIFSAELVATGQGVMVLN